MQTQKNRFNRPILTSAAAVSAAVLMLTLAPNAAWAAPTLGLEVSISADGTATFDANDEPGNDSSANNAVVRVNDTVTYQVRYSVNNEPGDNTTFTLTLPQGMEITAVPAYCTGAGSSIVPATAGTPSMPLQATAVNELVSQTLTCNLGTKSNAADTVFVTAKVLGVVPQGHSLAPTATLTADGATQLQDQAPAVVASSRLQWDLSKNSTALRSNGGYVNGPIGASCPWDTTLGCKFAEYPILLSAPAGGKGAMPAIGDITFSDDLSPEALYPSLDAAALAAINADLAKYGSRLGLTGCTSPLYESPSNKIGAVTPGNSNPATETTAVRDSGTCTISQPGGPGTKVSVTFSGADTTLRTYPTQSNYPLGSALPGDAAYAIVGHITVYTPVATILDFGVGGTSSRTLRTHNAYSDLEVHGLSGEVQTIAGQLPFNDFRDTTPTVHEPGDLGKYWVGEPGAAGNTGPTIFRPGNSQWEGPPGNGVAGSGGITVAPTQTVISNITVVGSELDYPQPMSAIVCDAWDNTATQLQAKDYQAGEGRAQWVGSGGKAVWVSGYNNVLINGSAQGAHNASEIPEYHVQYSATVGAAGPASTCGEDTGPWYDEPELVPGNDPALLAEGVYSAVSRVRVWIDIPPPNPGRDHGVRTNISLGMRVVDTKITGDIIPNWAGIMFNRGSSVNQADMLANPDLRWLVSTYNPADHSGAVGDRLIVAEAQARVFKQVKGPGDADFTLTPPSVTGGDKVEYKLSPSLTSGAHVPGLLKEMWVEDCLPASHAYSGASLTPTVVTVGSTPADAKRAACAAGDTYIRWVFPAQEVNVPIDPIIVRVDVSPTAPDGTYNNTVQVWAEDDRSTVAQRSAQAQTRIQNVAGVKLEKVALTPVVQVNRSGQTTNELLKWAVTLSNTLPSGDTSGLSNPDIIDVLPAQGSNGTAYTGSLAFVQATVTVGGNTVAVLYTNAATVNQDPGHSSNGSSGATAWCDAPSGGTLVIGTGSCPTSAATVTGLRVQRPGVYASGDTISFEIHMVGVANSAGDTYVNRTFARVENLSLPVGPVDRLETVVESSVGDYTWWDLNRDGLQTDGEPAAQAIPVTLTGTDDLGNAVSISTTTDNAGHYQFRALRASNSAGYTVTFTKPDGVEFTGQGTAKDDPALDSNPDPATGKASVTVSASSQNRTIDAGLLATGSLFINKLLSGVRVDEIASGETLEFTVKCTFEGDLVVDGTAVLEVEAGETVVTSETIDDIPVGAVCVITEVDHGSADESAPPQTVTIPFGGADPDPVSVSMTNYYSGGTVLVSKKVEGDADALIAVGNKQFTIQVTCQIEEPVAGGGVARTTVFSAAVTIKGGQTLPVMDGDEPVMLPVGARCFGEETVTGGATSHSVDFDSYEEAAVIAPSSGQLQELTITATNVFRCTPTTCLPIKPVGGFTPPIFPPPVVTPLGFTALGFTGSFVNMGTALLGGSLLVIGTFLVYRRFRSVGKVS